MAEREGPEPLTPAQIDWVKHRVATWFEIRRTWDRGYVTLTYGQLAADALHSALLHRLLEGKDPLPEPPPLRGGYPDYGAVEEGDEQ